VNALAYDVTSERQTKLVGHLVMYCDFVELVQMIWKRYLCPQLLDNKNDHLPQHIRSSLDVNIGTLGLVVLLFSGLWPYTPRYFL